MSKGRVLIIDDDAGIVEGLTSLLEDEGYLVSTAANGKLALDFLQEGGVSVDLILLDLMMPIMDGYKFRELQKSSPAISGIPVIVLTAGAQHIEKLAKMEVPAVLKKPIDIDVLLNEISNWFQPKGK